MSGSAGWRAATIWAQAGWRRQADRTPAQRWRTAGSVPYPPEVLCFFARSYLFFFLRRINMHSRLTGSCPSSLYNLCGLSATLIIQFSWTQINGLAEIRVHLHAESCSRP
jgi:hypothetical protein